MSDQAFTPRQFRDALSSFATGVTIVTASDESGEPIGMTASSFNSVSTEPPLVLWSVTKTALSANAFKQAEHFAVHVLATDQSDLANRFAKRGEDKFANVDFHNDSNGVPVIPDTAARFDCCAWSVYEGGDHWIIVGEVRAIESSKREGLVFGGGAYATAAPLTTIKHKEEAEVGSSHLVEDMLFYHLSRAYHHIAQEFHESVRNSGLTVSQWRICASLYGQSTCSFVELAARTFLDLQSLQDILSVMEEDGLCVVSDDNGERSATGTVKAHDQVKHLFALAEDTEKIVMANVTGVSGADIKRALKQMIL